MTLTVVAGDVFYCAAASKSAEITRADGSQRRADTLSTRAYIQGRRPVSLEGDGREGGRETADDGGEEGKRAEKFEIKETTARVDGWHASGCVYEVQVRPPTYSLPILCFFPSSVSSLIRHTIPCAWDPGQRLRSCVGVGLAVRSQIDPQVPADPAIRKI
ncbi:hypothetical protein EIP91_010782 [Steccherinum ochraceum]|uniref:Uncharacterized protein n=1 Tax=Steccherinum ochraceum TaxID=92696 RepID=A0A4R0R2D8_9APHY|nr:hypothetical protein EIP91_010782 [Steccherinum ochraceum]